MKFSSRATSLFGVSFLIVSQVLAQFERPPALVPHPPARRQQETITVTATPTTLTQPSSPSSELTSCHNTIRYFTAGYPPRKLPQIDWKFTTYAPSQSALPDFRSASLQNACNARFTTWPPEGTHESIVSAYSIASSIWRSWAESVHQEVWETLAPKCKSVDGRAVGTVMLLAALDVEECTVAVQLIVGSGTTTRTETVRAASTAAEGVVVTTTTATMTSAGEQSNTGVSVASTSSTAAGARETGFAGVVALVGVLGVHLVM